MENAPSALKIFICMQTTHTHTHTCGCATFINQMLIKFQLRQPNRNAKPTNKPTFSRRVLLPALDIGDSDADGDGEPVSLEKLNWSRALPFEAYYAYAASASSQ